MSSACDQMTRPSARRDRLGRVLAALVLTTALAACSTSREPIITGSLPNDGYKSRHPIVLAEQAETIDLPVGSQLTRLGGREASTVAAFAADSIEQGASGVTILVPAGSANEAAAARISRQIGAVLVQNGIKPTGVSYQPYRVDDANVDAPIRLAYPRMKAGLAHACGQWPDQMTVNPKNEDYWNFGCSTQANVAAMVVNPTDLVTPRGASAPNSTRRQTIFKSYEAGKPTASEQKLQNEGAITAVSGG